MLAFLEKHKGIIAAAVAVGAFFFYLIKSQATASNSTGSGLPAYGGITFDMGPTGTGQTDLSTSFGAAGSAGSTSTGSATGAAGSDTSSNSQSTGTTQAAPATQPVTTAQPTSTGTAPIGSGTGTNTPAYVTANSPIFSAGGSGVPGTNSGFQKIQTY